MKNKYIAKYLVGVIFLVAIPLANAYEQNIVMGVNMSVQQYSDDNLSENYQPLGAIFRLGVDLNKTWAFESRFGATVLSDSETDSGQTVKVANHGLLGLYGKAKLNLTSVANLYGLVGYSSYDISATSNATKSKLFDAPETSVSVGVGIESSIFKGWVHNVEFMHYSLTAGSELFAIEFGTSYLF